MKVTLEKKEKNTVEIEVEVDQQQINAALNRVYRQISQRVNIPGFRKGKAPRQLIERHVGADYVKNEALEVLIPEAYSSAIEEANIEPIAQPEVEVVRFATDDSLVFKAKIEVRPEVVLGNYLGLEIHAPQKKEIGDADVEKEIDSLRSRFATTQAVEPRPVRENDVVLLDFKGSSEGKEIENGSATDFKLEVLPGRFIPGFVESLIGMNPGETKMVELAFPENYPQKELAGKPATFEMTIKSIEEKVLPPIDEEFAKKSGFESVEKMKEAIRKHLEDDAEEEYQLALRKELIDQVLANVEVELPESMVGREINFMLQQYARNLQAQGIDPKQVLDQAVIERFGNENRSEAEKRIKTTLTLGAIARQENIAVEESEIDEEVANYAASYQTSPAEMKKMLIKNGGYASIADEVLSSKIIEWLLEKANVAA